MEHADEGRGNAFPGCEGAKYFAARRINAKDISVIRGQFHQQFTSSFYARRSQKCKKDSQIKQLFLLLGLVCVKAARKLLMKLTPDIFF